MSNKRIISTGTYLLTKEDGKHFGGITGYAYLPEYTTEIKLFIFDNLKSNMNDIENAQQFTFNIEELNSIKKGCEYIEINLKTLIQLSKRDKLNESAYFTDEENF